ncbi:MAG: tRNA epoxyqueuosine(34) reductase QueG [Planctomycetota bacterium]|jgi:epoxyqueuosine reductase|nr:tRNA epoxyqueuosine(34) reductase QueG [Planctomycetota bacterium]
MSNFAVPTSVALVQKLAAEVGLELRASLPCRELDPEVTKRFDNWLESGYHGDMNYLHRARDLGADLRLWKSWANSALLFALPYRRSASGFKGGGRVASYALGNDYHNVIGRKLRRLGKRLQKAGICEAARAAVDAAPVLEREWAIQGDLGWRGKNTLLIQPDHGPMVLLGELVIDAELPAWSPEKTRDATCGSCTSCLDVCPTDAFDYAYQLDARRCISYFTIEDTTSPIPLEFRAKMQDWVFGCDECSTICPFGDEKSDHSAVWGTHPTLQQLSLEDLLAISQQDFHKLFTGSPIRRAGWEGLLRNACVVLGNLRRGRSQLKNALDHQSDLVKEHADWALAQF